MIVQEANLTDLWHAACERLLFARKDETDFVNAAYTVDYDNILTAKSMEYEYDIGENAWLTRYRWHKLQRDYLVPHEVMPFVNRCKEIALGAPGRRGVITQMFFKQNKRDKENGSHQWGNCLMAITYRGGPRWTKPTFVVHSRVVFIAFLGGMDLALIWNLAKLVADATGQDVKDFAFRWYVDSIGWHSFKSVPYVMAHGWHDHVMDEDTYPDALYPSIRTARKSIRKFEERDLADFKFGQELRMAKRWHIVHYGDGFPSIPLSDMNLLPEMLEE